ncbi:MAG: WG repeat-containing protein [Algoriphagus sp.]|uniref:WG repeat-containing protein n=1 Tax=Algoriphagus sp. TaxID=1872435 RepID=UPI0017F2BD94|nr:WG repeat-containing protein [Algoriphagus sp.]NVJ85697.1 WG repeat-containing protein [Algoriphagus sp.]
MSIKEYFLRTLVLSLFLVHFGAFGQTWEVYDSELNLKNRLIYNDILLLSEAVRIAKTDEGLFLLKANYEKSVPLKGDEVYQYLAPWILVKSETGIGAYHEYGQLVLEPIYDEIEVFFNLLLARKENEYWVYDRGKGTTRSLGRLDFATIGSRGQVITRRNGSYFLPLSPIPHQAFDLIQDNDGDYLLVKNQHGFGLVNMEGKIILDPVIDTLVHTKGNFYYGFDQDQYLLIEGDPIKANVRYNSFHQITFKDDLMLEYIHGKLRRVMKEDGILLDAIGMTEVNRLGEKLYSVKFRDNKLGLLGINGWLVTPTDSILEIKNGSKNIFPARAMNGNWGFINSNGDWIIEANFEEVYPFENGRATIRRNGKLGLIDQIGSESIAPVWDEITVLDGGWSLAQQSNKVYLINPSGEYDTEAGFEKICRLSNGSFIAKKDQKLGLLTRDGQWKMELLFNQITPLENDWYQARIDDRVGLFSNTGENKLPVAFEDILYDESTNMILAKSPYEPIILVEEEPEKKKKKKGQ